MHPSEDLTPPWRPSRRTVLIGAAAALAAACSSDDVADDTGTDSSEPPTTTPSASDAPTTTDGGDPATAATTEPAPTTAPDTDTDTSNDTSTEGTPPALTPAMFAALAVCRRSASAAEGPFPNIDRLERQDVSEGYPGHPLRLGIRVVDDACEPVPDATVRIWHADASGDYSAYADGGGGKDEGEGTNFCRGFQVSDADGIVEFHTIYPGWYTGRAVHIHLQVVIDGSEALTTQLYFDEAYTADVMATGEYAQFGPPDTGWADDRLIGTPTTDGTGLVLSPGATIAGSGTLGLINVGV